MPIEREFKFVLKAGHALDADLRAAAAIEHSNVGGSVSACTIYQGYLQKGSRVRRIQPAYLLGIPSSLTSTVYRYTYKHKLTKQPGDLEIECEISEEDFELAWAEAEQKLYKIRVVVPMGNYRWEIDHFYESRDHFIDGLQPYLVMAEVEVPDHFTHIKKQSDIPLHPIIEKHLLLAVPEGDSRFSNRMLGDAEHVATLLDEVASGKIA